MNPAVICQLVRHWWKRGRMPEVIPMGGSCPLGILGFVNAVFELNKQVREGKMPEPDCIYAPCGSMGTVAGLILGLKALKSKTRVVAIRVNAENVVNKTRMLELLTRTNRFLSSLDSSFPGLSFTADDIDLRHGFVGQRYALFTPEGKEAVSFAEKHAGIKLEGTYTGKAFACLMEDARKFQLKHKTVLFWNTHNSRDLSHNIADLDYHRLPGDFHRYFEEEVQALDR
jgi:D-cysteine desulfhydrase